VIVECPTCHRRFDDEFRPWTCPHAPFLANDGHNNFAYHPESYLEPESLADGERRARTQGEIE